MWEEEDRQYQEMMADKELEDFTYEDFELVGYDPWPHIKGEVSV